MKGKRQKDKKFKWMKVVYTSRRKTEGPLQNARYELYPKITMEGRWLEESMSVTASCWSMGMAA